MKMSAKKFFFGCSRVFAFVLSLLIKTYQYFLSPFLGKNCKHYPSCSCYSKQAIGQYGVTKGIILSTARIIRCNPWSHGGHDPVPEKVNFGDIKTFKFFGNYQNTLYEIEEKQG